MRLLYAPLLSESEERIEAERCWAGTRNGASNCVVRGPWGLARSEDARRRVSSRGGIVVCVAGAGVMVVVGG
jgi:hypothetical protein